MTKAASDFPEQNTPTEVVAQWRAAAERLKAALGELARHPPRRKTNRKYDRKTVIQSLAFVGKAIVGDPRALVRFEAAALKEWGGLLRSGLAGKDKEPFITPDRGDKRFADSRWDDSRVYRSIKQSYLLASRQLRDLVGSAEAEPGQRALAQFLVEQYINAVAPTNFVLTNPVAVRRTIESRGANLVGGFANFLSDVAEGRGIVRRRAEGTFIPGETIAATPGSVVFENKLFQLIQYDPSTPTVRRRPLLYAPPLVNKFYMLDLKPRSSMMRWLVEQGHTVFTISWVDPGPEHADCALDDYIESGILTAIDKVAEATGEKTIDLFGFCMGGTLVAIALAWLAAAGQAEKAGSAALIGSVVDFANMREWSAFAHEAHFEALNDHLGTKGYIDKDELQQLFSLIRANDLIWSSFVNHYLLDKDAPPSDLLYWFEDGSHIPSAFMKSYNEMFLHKNRLRKPGAVTLLGQELDLSKVTTPLLMIALKEDHVSGWSSVYDGVRLFGGPKRFVLGGSGHNAGVINPPAANKHGFWTNDALPEAATEWLDGAVKQPGSWWPEWTAWLKKLGGDEQVTARVVGGGTLHAIEPAPGSFVTGPPAQRAAYVAAWNRQLSPGLR